MSDDSSDGGDPGDTLDPITVTAPYENPDTYSGITTSLDPSADVSMSGTYGTGNTPTLPSQQGGLSSGVSSLLSALGLNSNSNLSALALLAKLGAAATGAKGTTNQVASGSLKTNIPGVSGQGTAGSSATNGQGYGPGGKGYAFVNYLNTPQAPKTQLPQSAFYTYGQQPETNFGVSQPGMATGGQVRRYDSGGIVPPQPTAMGGMVSGQPMNAPPQGVPASTLTGPMNPVPQTPSTIPAMPAQGAIAQPGAPAGGRPAQLPPSGPANPPNGINSVTGAPRIGTPLMPPRAPMQQAQMPPMQHPMMQPQAAPAMPGHPYGAPSGPYGAPAAHMAGGGGVDASNPYGAAQTPGVSRHVKGAGDGTSDSIPARLASGEYVIDAQGVSMLGNGDNDAGAKKLDAFRKNLRAHKGAALAKGRMAPDAKTIQAYMPKSQ